ncbi:MAG: hypothetical protein FVQ84_22900 [Planctomycetes bacterium]|nr:hypothetical protein [Planctomycetota bacterium]
MEDQKPDNVGTGKAEKAKSISPPKFAHKLPAAGWGLFFIWIGIAMLLQLGTGVILLGIGAITLMVQVARKYLNLRLELFNVVMGFLFMMAGFWENYKPDLPLIPVFLIVVGTGLLLSFIRHLISK